MKQFVFAAVVVVVVAVNGAAVAVIQQEPKTEGKISFILITKLNSVQTQQVT